MGCQEVEYLPHLPGRMAVDPQVLAARLAALNGAPALATTSAGAVNTGDFDDLEALAALCKMYGAWLHVDGAFGLFAACDPARSHLLRGLSSKTDRKVSKGRSRATPSRSSVRHRDRHSRASRSSQSRGRRAPRW